MNQERRKKLYEIRGYLRLLRMELAAVHQEEIKTIRNIPQAFTDTAQCCNAETAVSNLNTALEAFDEAATAIENASY